MKDRDDLFDREIRNKLKKEINSVPEDANKKMNDAFNKLRNRKYKKMAGVCAACVAGTLIFGITMPTYAQNIPVIGKIFEVFDDNRYENYDKYSSDLNVTKEDNGYRVTINKVIYDGIELSILYTVESNKEVKEEFDIVDMDLKIKNKKLNLGFGGRGEYIDDNTYVGMRDYGVNDSDLMPKDKRKELYGDVIDVPDEFNLKIEINSLGSLGTEGDIKGKWDFNIPVSSELVNGNVHEQELDLKISEDGTTIKKFIQTPLNTVIKGIYYEENGYGSSSNFILFDDKGRYILPKGSSAGGVSDGEDSTALYFTTNYKEVYDDSESLTIIPFKDNHNKKIIQQEIEEKNNEKVTDKEELNGNSNIVESEATTVITNEEVKVNLNDDSNKEVVLEDGSVYSKIESVESDGKTTKIYFESKNSIYGMPVHVVNNETGEKILIPGDIDGEDTDKMIIESLRYLGSDKYVVSFDGDLTKGDYSAVFSIDEHYERAGKSIIVDLK